MWLRQGFSFLATLHSPPGLQKTSMLSLRTTCRRLIHQSIKEITAYHHVADQTLDDLNTRFEALAEAQPPSKSIDSDYAMGVLTVRLPGHATIVLNKQPPIRQIWSSSPVSGPRRFDWDGQQWLWTKNSQTSLLETLRSDLKKLDLITSTSSIF